MITTFKNEDGETIKIVVERFGGRKCKGVRVLMRAEKITADLTLTPIEADALKQALATSVVPTGVRYRVKAI